MKGGDNSLFPTWTLLLHTKWTHMPRIWTVGMQNLKQTLEWETLHSRKVAMRNFICGIHILTDFRCGLSKRPPSTLDAGSPAECVQRRNATPFQNPPSTDEQKSQDTTPDLGHVNRSNQGQTCAYRIRCIILSLKKVWTLLCPLSPKAVEWTRYRGGWDAMDGKKMRRTCKVSTKSIWLRNSRTVGIQSTSKSVVVWLYTSGSSARNTARQAAAHFTHNRMSPSKKLKFMKRTWHGTVTLVYPLNRGTLPNPYALVRAY